MRQVKRISLFFLVQGVAYACCTHLAASLAVYGPLLGYAAASVTMIWAYEAHSRWTFRTARTGGPEAMLKFMALDWATLLAVSTVGFGGVVVRCGTWLAATLLAYCVVQGRLWFSSSGIGEP